jgi:hypothetical protein
MNSPIQSRLARLAVAAGVTVAGVGATVAVAAPAHAAVSTVSVAAAAGVPTQSATAVCPAGEYLTGGGGRIDGGGRDVTLTDVIPDINARTVTVWGHTNGAAAPAYSVVAQAICRPGPPPANYTLVRQTTGSTTDVIKSVTAVCPNGTNLLGGGAELRQAFGQAFHRWALPDFALTRYTVLADASAPLAGSSWEAVSYAICGTPPGVAPIRLGQAYIGGPDPTNSKTQTTGACPAGMVTTGVGGNTATGPDIGGFVFLNRLTTDVTQTNARADAIEGLNPGAAVAWTLNTYNICWA